MCRRHSPTVFVLLVVLTAAALTGTAQASNGNSQSNLTSPQPLSNADQNPGGANGQCPGGPYCSTRDGSPSLNGNGGGNANGKPCAGCVGKADNKNPQGQMPNGSDPNNGYECDGNNGIGKSNPAHTSCKAGTPTPPPVVPPVTPPVSPPVATPPSPPAQPTPSAPQPPVTPVRPVVIPPPGGKGGIGTAVCVVKNKKGKFVPCKHKPTKKAHKKPKLHHPRRPRKLHYTP